MEISNLIIFKKLFNNKKLYTKSFFVSSHSVKLYHTYYQIANSVYMN